MTHIPNDLELALKEEAVDSRFSQLQPDVKANFAYWVEHAVGEDMRRRRIERIVAAVKAIQSELDR